MFSPIYNISDKILKNIKTVSVLIAEFNLQKLPQIVLMDFEKKANSLSTYASTSIEGNPLPLTDVKRIIKQQPKNIRDTEREVLNYNGVLEKLNEKMKNGSLPINLKTICNIQRSVTQDLIEKFRCGKLRKEPVFVNDPISGKTIYLPPDHKDVPRLLKELIDFAKLRRNHLDALILAGIFHKQFVIIHPFVDGNGRTARLLTKILLADMGLNTFPLFSFENYYNKNVSQYFQKVGVWGDYYDLANTVNFTEWLEYFTDGIIDELLRVKKELQKETIAPDQILQPHHKKILQLIQKQGFITDKDYSKITQRAKATRALDFKKLLDMGLIERFGRGRATYYKIK